MARMTKEEAYRAGLENPLAGDIGPLQRLYGTVQAISEELGGADMGTPFGQRFGQRQAATKAEVKRLQALRAAYPEEFGRGMMVEQERLDPYMLDLGLGTARAMRPGMTTFSPAGRGMPAQEMPVRELPAAASQRIGYAPAPEVPYYRTVPPEMGTSMQPMTPFQQNQVGLTTGRYGMRGYAPEMAVTDFETYGPFNRQSSGPMAGRATGFDRNAYEAWKQGRFNRMAGRPEPMGGDYTLEDLGQAVAPYRQGGLVYEPVGAQAGPRQIGGLGMTARLGYARGPIEGEWSDVYGIAGPRTGTAMTAGPRPYGGSMDFGVTREGMAASPSGMMFDPRVAAGAAGIGYLAGLPREQQQMAQAGGTAPRGATQLPPIDVFGPRGMSALSGQTPGAGTAFEAPRRSGAPQGKRAGAKKKGAEQGPPMPAKGAFEPNFNYLVTQAIDRLLGQNEAEKGRQFEEYYATNPWPY